MNYRTEAEVAARYAEFDRYGLGKCKAGTSYAGWFYGYLGALAWVLGMPGEDRAAKRIAETKGQRGPGGKRAEN